MKGRVTAAFVLGLLGLAIGGGVSPAFAAGETNIDYVDVSNDGKVSVLLAVDGIPAGDEVQPESVTVRVGQQDVPATAQRVEGGDLKRTSVLALDASLSMKGTKFSSAKAAAQSFLDAAPADVAVGLLTFSRQPQAAVAPTTSRAAVSSALEGVELTGGTGLYDAVVAAVELAGAEGARSVLVLSDGRDVSSKATVGDAVTAAESQGVVVDFVSLDQDAGSESVLSEIATPSGGRVIPASSSALASLFAAQAQAMSSQLLVTFDMPPSPAEEADLAISVVAGGTEYTDSTFVTFQGAVSDGPRVVDGAGSSIGDTALWAGGAALGLGLAGLLVVVLVGGSRHGSEIEQQMAFYTGAEATRTTSAAPPSSGVSFRQTATSATEKLIKGDFETRISQRLNGAGLSLTAAEWLLLHAAIAIGAAFLGLTFGGGPLMVVLGVAGIIVPWFYLRTKHRRRLAAFNSQLAETLQLIAGGLSAGLSLPQAIDTVVREGQEPMAGEMRRALVEQRLGVDIEDALDGVAERMESKDFSWVVMAIRIQREVGGNLSELLITVADTLRERDYLRGQVKVLSAEGRISAWVLGGLPILMFLYMLMVRRDFVRPLYTEPLGLVLSAGALTLIGLGFWTMSRLVKIEV